MSFIQRPRAVINGVRRTRTYRFFWCRQCDRTVRIGSSSDPYNFLCPLCYNLVCQELHVSRPGLASQQQEPSTSAAQLIDTMTQMLEVSSSSRTWIRPSRISVEPSRGPPRPVSPPENALSRAEDSRLPASTKSAPVECIPVVRMTADLLDRDPTCPICKEDFVVDEKIRQMPCNHFYHSACIIPWIEIHSTCPVCRYQIPMPQNSDDSIHSSHFQAANHYVGEENINQFTFEDAMNLSWPSWAELFSLWPFSFRSLLNWSFHDPDESLNDTASSSRSASSWWRYLMIL